MGWFKGQLTGARVGVAAGKGLEVTTKPSGWADSCSGTACWADSSGSSRTYHRLVASPSQALEVRRSSIFPFQDVVNGKNHEFLDNLLPNLTSQGLSLVPSLAFGAEPPSHGHSDRVALEHLRGLDCAGCPGPLAGSSVLFSNWVPRRPSGFLLTLGKQENTSSPPGVTKLPRLLAGMTSTRGL